jgi:hypothetical protein
MAKRVFILSIAVFIYLFPDHCYSRTSCPVSDKSQEGTVQKISLAGFWKIRLDSFNIGVHERWYLDDFEDVINLPGTTDENKMGIYKDEWRDDRLSRVYYWKGPAWYQYEITIPEKWKNKQINLYLERTKNTRVWMDSVFYGQKETLSTPHIYDITRTASAGKHTLTILVDNSLLPPVGPAHAVDERTQTNWNGILGDIELRATEKLFVEEIQVNPDIENDRAIANVKIGNLTQWGGNADLILQARTYNVEDQVIYEKKIWPVAIDGRDNWFNITYEFDKDYPLWDEFNPSLMELVVTIETQPGKDWLRSTSSAIFGMRSFTSGGRGFKINRKGTFLRGKVDCCIFPLTGYPPMDKQGWLQVFEIAKSYGLNHYRFHSWCPPEAAFQAADEMGMYLQPELPNKRGFGNTEHDEYLKKEGEEIFKAYGNHPSFVMFTLGNELGRNEAYYEMVSHFRRTDPRHLYAQGSNNSNYLGGDPSLPEGDDFWVTTLTSQTEEGGLPVRGFYFPGKYKGHIEHKPPSTLTNYDRSIAGCPVPVVAHEIGAIQVSPDFSEIPKYTGVLRARNLEIFRERLKAKHMLDQADDFFCASGALAVICYREDIESALRTSHFGGFQLLDLQDFPGQGTALVGMLNAFMESKGFIEPAEWRAFCSEVVPLLKMKKYTWTNSEIFIGTIELSHYGPADFKESIIDWAVINDKGETIFSGSADPMDIQQGRLSMIDMFSFPLEGVKAPQKLTINLSLRGTKYKNHYNIWVFNKTIDNTVPDNLLLSRSFDKEAEEYLKQGGNVILIPDKDSLLNSLKGAFQTDFWCYPMFRRSALTRDVEVAPGTMGILCDPSHEALAGFPTESHSNWQWWHLVKNSNPVILDETPPDFRPIVQVIDNFWRNHKLGLVFETKVGKGKLLVCSIDLLDNQDLPEARQMLHSLLGYAGSPKFSPRKELSVESLRSILTIQQKNIP